jgi:hypothetical protein
MNPKKDPKDKSKSSGISLEPELINRAKLFAKNNGFGSLSNFARFLITQELNKNEGEKSYLLNENTPSPANGIAPHARTSSVRYPAGKTKRRE